jgi:raffinose/stachyose/melibiose transport system permease protein
MIVARREVIIGRLIVLAAIAFTLIPLLSMFSAALQPQGTIPRGFDWPENPQWGNFVEAFNQANMAALLRSSLIIEAAVVPVSVLMATMAGFALGQLRIAGGKVVFVVILAGLAMPFEVIITPLYYQIRDLGLLNTKWAIVLPLIALFMPFGVFWMRSHFLNLSPHLSEAAVVDGASRWQLFRHIHLPLAKPAMATLGILFFIWTWNQFILALVMVNRVEERTMAGALMFFQGQWGIDVVMLSAGSLVILAPTLVLFLVFQRQFVKALLQGGVKG